MVLHIQYSSFLQDRTSDLFRIGINNIKYRNLGYRYSSGKLTASDILWHEVNLGFKPTMLVFNLYTRTTDMTTAQHYTSMYYSENRNGLDSNYFVITDTGFKYNMVQTNYVRGYFMYAACGK